MKGPEPIDVGGADVPAFLVAPPKGAITYGKLTRERAKGGGMRWVIEGHPAVVAKAKLLFPGAEGRLGAASFPATVRGMVDLCWFLQRWPLEIADRKTFDAELRGARAHVARRAEIARSPKATKPGALFRGELKPFQAEGVTHLLAERRTLLADEMGLGKTPQALAAIATLDRWPVVVCAPSHLLTHWRRKVDQFLTTATMVLGRPAGSGITVEQLRGRTPSGLPPAQVLLIHYGLIDAWANVLEGAPVVVFDEVQELRHGDTRKYAAAAQVAQAAECVWGLSGTPIYNKGSEIYNVLDVIDARCLGDPRLFAQEWCGGSFAGGVDAPEVLAAHLRSEGLILRRRKSDVMAEMPAKMRIVEPIDLEQGLFAQVLRKASALARQAASEVKPLERGRVEREAIAMVRKGTGEAKAPAVATWLDMTISAGEPVVCFAHHHAVIDAIAAKCRDHNPVIIDGRRSEAEKADAITAFAEGRSDLCIIGLRAATGLDGLQTRGRVIVFAELDWSPAVHAQAEDRAHRIGQERDVLVYYLVADGGSDPAMLECVGFKVEQFQGVMGDPGESAADRALAESRAQDFMRKLLDELRAGN